MKKKILKLFQHFELEDRYEELVNKGYSTVESFYFFDTDDEEAVGVKSWPPGEKKRFKFALIAIKREIEKDPPDTIKIIEVQDRGLEMKSSPTGNNRRKPFRCQKCHNYISSSMKKHKENCILQCTSFQTCPSSSLDLHKEERKESRVLKKRKHEEMKKIEKEENHKVRNLLKVPLITMTFRNYMNDKLQEAQEKEIAIDRIQLMQKIYKDYEDNKLTQKRMKEELITIKKITDTLPVGMKYYFAKSKIDELKGTNCEPEKIINNNDNIIIEEIEKENGCEVKFDTPTGTITGKIAIFHGDFVCHSKKYDEMYCKILVTRNNSNDIDYEVGGFYAIKKSKIYS